MNNRLNLSVCGGKRFSAEAVKAVPTPEPTNSWRPIPHGLLVEEFRKQIKARDLKVKDSYLTLARPTVKGGNDGQRFFGLFHVEGIQSANSKDIGTIIGLRNSHDKAFAAGICAGSAPFVCTNLIFSNEITLGRKHTVNILADLSSLIGDAIGKLGSLWANQDERIEAYRNFNVTDMHAHDLIIKAFQNGAIPKTKIADVAQQWHNPEHDEFASRNGWSLYNAFTNALRGNVVALNDRSDSLHGTLDLAFGLNKAEAITV